MKISGEAVGVIRNNIRRELLQDIPMFFPSVLEGRIIQITLDKFVINIK